MKSYKEKISGIIKEFNNGYGSVETSGGPLFALSVFLTIMATAFIYPLILDTNLNCIEKFIYLYLSALFVTLILLISGIYFYLKKKNSHKRKKLKCIYAIITVGLFFIVSSLVMIPYSIIRHASKQVGNFFRMENVAKSILALLMGFVTYVVEFLTCTARLSTIATYSFGIYLLYVIGIHILGSLIRKITDICYVYGNSREKYSYKCEMRIIQIQFINVLTLLTGVAGLFISDLGNDWAGVAYLIMPGVVFSGIEQIMSVPSKRTEEERAFIRTLYDEMVLLKDVAIPQIMDVSAMKIRIKLSVEPYVVEYQKNYIISFKWFSKKKQKMVEDTLSSMKDLLLNEYAVYEESEQVRFIADVETNINNLAECLLRI